MVLDVNDSRKERRRVYTQRTICEGQEPRSLARKVQQQCRDLAWKGLPYVENVSAQVDKTHTHSPEVGRVAMPCATHSSLRGTDDEHRIDYNAAHSVAYPRSVTRCARAQNASSFYSKHRRRCQPKQKIKNANGIYLT